MNTDKGKKMWFRSKYYGWGWFPITWEGWLVIGIFVAAIIVLAFTLLPKNGQDFPGIFAASVIVLTIILVITCYKKGEKLKWRWGRPKGE